MKRRGVAQKREKLKKGKEINESGQEKKRKKNNKK